MERLSCGLLVQGLQVRQLLLECGHVRDAGHIRVVVRVVTHNVALCRHAADDVGSRFDHMPHHKEGGGGIVLFQGVQYGLCAAVLISAVKGEVEDLLAGIPQVVGAVLGQVLRRGIAHWGFPLCGEG